MERRQRNKIEKRLSLQTRLGLGLTLLALLLASCGQRSTLTPIPTVYGGDRLPTPITEEAPPELVMESYTPIDGNSEIDPDFFNQTPLKITKKLYQRDWFKQYFVNLISKPEYNQNDCNKTSSGDYQTVKAVRQKICQALETTASAWKTTKDKLINRFYPEFVALSDEETDKACGAPAVGCSYPEQKTIVIDATQIDPLLIAHEASHSLIYFPEKTCINLGGNYVVINSTHQSIYFTYDQYPNEYYLAKYISPTEHLAMIELRQELIPTISEGLVYMLNHPDALPMDLIRDLYYLNETWTRGFQLNSDYPGTAIEVARFIIKASQSDVPLFQGLTETGLGSIEGYESFLMNLSLIDVPDQPPSLLNGLRVLAKLHYAYIPGHLNPEPVPVEEMSSMCP